MLSRILSFNSFLKMNQQFSTFAKTKHNFINGVRVNTINSNRVIPVFKPANGAKLFEMPVSVKEDVNAAVKCAERAFESWSSLSGFERGKLLRATATKIRENAELIAQTEVLDTGKPIWEARFDIACCADTFEYYGGIAPTIQGSYHQLANGSFAQVHVEPLGVVCGIGVWNYPFQSMSWKSAPALACGNTFVFKPSEMTPISAVLLGELMTEAGMPHGVVNIVQGDSETGQLLCQHPGIAKVSFTGSVPTGQKIMSLCSDGLKPLTLELGGKSPLIVFGDSDIEQAVKATMIGNFLTQGEVCSNCTRVFVERNILDQFVTQLVEATGKMVIGDPMREETTVGASISAQHAQKVLSYIEEAQKQGAIIASGGKRVNCSEEFSGGYYLSPCILTNCNDEMKIVKEEVFGAVVSVLVFDQEEEALKRANNTTFGLAAGVMTKDLSRAHRVANKLKAGIVWINNYNIFPVEVPFGGFKMSGFGRENGLAAIQDFTQTKTVYVEMSNIDCPIYKL